MGLPCPTLRLGVLKADALEAQLGHNTPEEGRGILQVAQHLDKGLVIQAKAREMLYLVDGRHLLDHLVIAGAQEPHDGVFLAGGLDAGDNLGPPLPLCHNPGQHLDGVLEVAAHQDGTVARGLEHAIIGAVELAEVLGVEDGLDLGIAGTDLAKEGAGIVTGVVIDEYDLVVVLTETAPQFLDNGIGDGYDIFFLVVTRNQDTKFLHVFVWF